MKQFASVPFNRFMELAVLSGHVNDMTFGDACHVTLDQQLDYIKFALAVGEKLQNVNIGDLQFHDILDIAAKTARYSESTICNKSWFFYRFAHKIAKELA